MTSDTFWVDEFDRKANQPSMWRVVADELVIAGDLLARVFKRVDSMDLLSRNTMPKELRLRGPILLLRAAAMEALLKGRAVRRGYKFVVAGKFRPIPNT